jgi:hypothetical protein
LARGNALWLCVAVDPSLCRPKWGVGVRRCTFQPWFVLTRGEGGRPWGTAPSLCLAPPLACVYRVQVDMKPSGQLEAVLLKLPMSR